MLRREGFILPVSEKMGIKNGSRKEETFELGFREQVGVHQMGQIREGTIMGKRMSKRGKTVFKGN